jgi:hypothetical protein
MHLFLLSTLIYRLLIVLINVSLLSTPHAFKCTCFDQRIFTIYTNIIQALNCLDQRIFTVSTKIEALNCLDHRIFTATHEDTGSELSRSTYLYSPHEDTGSELSRSSYLYCHARIYRNWIVSIDVSLLSTPPAFKYTCFDQRIFTVHTKI